MSVTPITKPDHPRQGSNQVYEEMADAMRRKAMRDDYDKDMQYQRRDHEGMGSHATFNGSTKFINSMLSIIAALLIAGICGEVVVYGQVQRLEGAVTLIIEGKIRIPP